MKLPWILFGLCLAMCCVVAALILFVDEVPGGHGAGHPVFDTMSTGGDGAARHENLLVYGWVFGVLQICFFVACLAFGASKKERVGALKVPLLAGTAVYLLVFTFLVFSYRAYMLEETHALFLAFPRPTAWMLYGIWIFPVFFIFLYMFTFDRLIFTDDDQLRFEEIIAERRRSEAGGA
ncbi:MAG: hypothetical protein IIB38_11605 [Candidatus Hydrogenedentes bacterium]|nr:hypothetical protein [Candidatus Hydrogenedentota bacterium]